MTTFTDDELAALRAVAEAATVREWRVDHGRYICGVGDGFALAEAYEYGRDENAAHIAAFSPPTVLRLLAELAAALDRVAELEEENADYKRRMYAAEYQLELTGLQVEQDRAAQARVRALLDTWPNGPAREELRVALMDPDARAWIADDLRHQREQEAQE